METNHYHVYGIGNALVDIEYRVSAEQLHALGIDKGVMTLVPAERQRDIMQQLGSAHVKRSCGGSAANTIIAMTQFGGRAYYSCKLAADELGSFYLQDLLQHGVSTNLTGDSCEPGDTGTCLVFVTADADRTMNTYLGITGDLSATELSTEAIHTSDYVYIEGYLVASPAARAAAIRARELARAANTPVALTLSDANMVEYFKDGLLDIIGDGVDLLFANESEALKMANSSVINDAVAHLKTLSRAWVLTRGPQGALVYDGEVLHEIEPHPVTAIDTLGAGDMFAGAFLYGITHQLSYAAAGSLAAHAAAELVTEYGPRLSNARVRDIVRQHTI